MGRARNGSAELEWYEQGDGEPLLLIMGMGGSAMAWYRLLPHLGGLRAVSFDNRGTGRSSAIRGHLTLGAMVADTVAVMDDAGLESAHVLGVSMGGMIAQNLAIEHPERVRSLILGCTTAQTRVGVPPWRLLSAAWVRALAPDVAISMVLPALYAQRTRSEAPERIREDLAMRRRDATASRTIFAQMGAVARHDRRGRLGELRGLRVTVIHGSEDALVPVERGRELAALIPGADLVEVPQCGHLLLTDAEDDVLRALDGHFAAAGTLAA
jgi:pimeloyl-ACP methyl ester carboxylesterase